ncbi:hypothetical protein M8998_06960 [Sphingobacterium sp. lm-10]|uniref:hypothetical protein n=1 Tax=Sphingobacterium sp. lm-10 TaxID=2944904 RepID=UPI002021ADA9|nr:hypothetical protein [Sphingobacterium sp. lm-10]MCL7987673.1 hypothetical protein [Sphingobacterium sp. lm-10]
MDNTLENKAKFFTVYWGQIALKESKYPNSPSCKVCETFIEEFKNYHLQLKPLSAISEQHLKELLPLVEETSYMRGYMNPNMVKQIFTYYEKTSKLTGQQWINVVDFLRRNGYAWEWNGVSVEEQVDKGWAVLESEVSNG